MSGFGVVLGLYINKRFFIIVILDGWMDFF